MAVMSVITAQDGDSLCSIAVEHGFKNCTKLRNVNPDFAARQVQPGDRVTIPEVTQKREAGQVDQLHKFKRLGRLNRVWIIQDRNRPRPNEALGDQQRELAVSNYVPGRQGRGFATALWKDQNFTDFDDDASADPDHFKVLSFDRFAQAAGQNSIEVTLQVQKPVLGSVRNEVARWEDLTDAGTKLEHVVCKQFRANSRWYRSPYLRLVVDNQDRTCKRRDGRNDAAAGAVDAGPDVSQQTLLVPPLLDKDIEILDLRVVAFRPAPGCEAGGVNDPQHCRAQSIAEVGKEERVMRIKVVRVGGAAGSGSSDAEMRTLVFLNLRRRLAQINVGVKTVVEPGPGITLVDNFIHDVPLPNNMIMISDFDGVRAGGGRPMSATVALAAGNVTGQIRTQRRDTPQQTAEKLAAALRTVGVTCRVSPNPPITTSTNNFGSCDILCFKADGTPARIITATTTDSKQTIAHTGGWTNGNVVDGDFYGSSAREVAARMVGSPDYRSAAKNFHTGSNALLAIVVNNLPGLNGEAILPHLGLTEKFRPLRVFQLLVFLSHGGATSEVTLSHEGGHAILDCFHTSSRNGAGQEQDILGNLYPVNDALAFSEWMSAFPHPNQIRKRISDTPLTVWLTLLRTGVSNVQGVNTLMGGRNAPIGPINPTSSQRFREHCAFLFENLRRLRPVPPAPV